MATEMFEEAQALAGESITADVDGGETELRETVDAALSEARVDRSSRRISSAKLCGRHSQNGRVYLKPAFKEAQHLYEGAVVRLDHSDKGQDIGLNEAVGVVRNPTPKNDGLHGDIEVFEGPVGDKLLDMAERAPDVFGASHEAGGKVERSRDGNDKVREITEVRGVALVPNPATTNSLFEELRESIEGDDMEDRQDWREADMAEAEQRLFRGRGYAPDLDLGTSEVQEVEESEQDGPDLGRVAERLFI